MAFNEENNRPNTAPSTGVNKEKIPAHTKEKRHSIDTMLEVNRFPKKELDQLKLVYPSTNNSQLINSFREIRTRLFTNSKSKNYACLISSVVPEGGASYVAKNLAATIALDPTKTALLIDCNLYSPSVEQLIIGKPENGITDYLYNKNISIKDIIYASGIPRLRIIPVGNNREGGAEHFSNPLMRAFIGDVKKSYPDRFIIVIAPPANSYAAEAFILADLCDFAILIVPYGKVTKAQILASIDAIKEEKLAGIVFNN